jgi:hypothetical protein
MIPKLYETFVVPTWDLVDNASTSSTGSSNISSTYSFRFASDEPHSLSRRSTWFEDCSVLCIVV